MSVHRGLEGVKMVRFRKEEGKETGPLPRSNRGNLQVNKLIRHYSKPRRIIGSRRIGC